MGPSLGDKLENEKALVYCESFFATGATGLATPFSGEPFLLFGLIRAATTVQFSVNFSPHLFLNESHLLSLEICTVPLITFSLHWVALWWMPFDQ